MLVKFTAKKYRKKWMHLHFLGLLLLMFYLYLAIDTWYEELLINRYDVLIKIFYYHVLPIIFLILEITIFKYKKHFMLSFFIIYGVIYLFGYASNSLLHSASVMSFFTYLLVVSLITKKFYYENKKYYFFLFLFAVFPVFSNSTAAKSLINCHKEHNGFVLVLTIIWNDWSQKHRFLARLRGFH